MAGGTTDAKMSNLQHRDAASRSSAHVGESCGRVRACVLSLLELRSPRQSSLRVRAERREWDGFIRRLLRLDHYERRARSSRNLRCAALTPHRWRRQVTASEAGVRRCRKRPTNFGSRALVTRQRWTPRERGSSRPERRATRLLSWLLVTA